MTTAQLTLAENKQYLLYGQLLNGGFAVLATALGIWILISPQRRAAPNWLFWLVLTMATLHTVEEYIFPGGFISWFNSIGLHTFVLSRSLRAADYPEVNMVAEDAASLVRALRSEEGRDIWLVGGGMLFRTLLEAGLVDTVEVGIRPVLLGRGIPLLPPSPRLVRLELMGSKVFGGGQTLLSYAVRSPAS